MQKRFVSGFLMLVMTGMLLHVAIPHHHHHEGVLMHNHDHHPDDDGGCPGKGHHPAQCLISSIDISLPRTHGTGKLLTFPVSIDLFGFVLPTCHVSAPDTESLYILEEFIEPPGEGNPFTINARGPPRMI